MNDLIRRLTAAEAGAIRDVIAFMSYNPSIGRVLEEKGVDKFRQLTAEFAAYLAKIRDIGSFDDLHSTWVRRLIDSMKTSRGGTPTFGQAQKPINVFLKVYVDWAGKPDLETRKRLEPFLHVPLDRIIMKSIKEMEPSWYRRTIRPSVHSPQQEFSLSKMNENAYTEWQRFFRGAHPEKPLLFDVIWALNRREGRADA